MPKVFEWKGYRFHFFSNEGDPREPMHIHVRKGPKRAKFWIEPVALLVNNYGYTRKEVNAITVEIDKKKDLIKEAWHEHFDI